MYVTKYDALGNGVDNHSPRTTLGKISIFFCFHVRKVGIGKRSVLRKTFGQFFVA